MRGAMIGRISGALGLLLLLSSWVTWFITSGSPWLAGGKAVVGAVLIGLYFATNWKQFGQFASRRSTFFMGSTAVMTLLVVGLLGAANYVADKRAPSWDLTRNRIFSLSPQTMSALTDLKEKVTALAFLPPEDVNYDAVEDLLGRYARESSEKFEYVFKDPRKAPDLAQKYALREGQLTIVLTRGEGTNESHTSVSLQTLAELGAEQELTNALIKLNAVGEQKVYFVEGHGEWAMDTGGNPMAVDAAVSELVRSLRQEGYAPEALNLLGKTEVPRDAAVVVVAGAKHRLTDPEVALLRSYLDEGGRLLVFADSQVDNGLDGLLAQYGMQVDEGMAADGQFAIGSPYVLASLFYGDHPIAHPVARKRQNVQFPGTRALTLLREGLLPGVEAKPVVLSSPFAWLETSPNEQPEPSEGEKTGQLVLVAASSRKIDSTNKRFDEARVVVFGDSELLLDVNWGVESNRNLVMNAFAWNTNQTNKITIRPPDRDVSTLDLDPGMLANIRFLSMDLLPIMLLGIGLAIWQTRRNK